MPSIPRESWENRKINDALVEILTVVAAKLMWSKGLKDSIAVSTYETIKDETICIDIQAVGVLSRHMDRTHSLDRTHRSEISCMKLPASVIV